MTIGLPGSGKSTWAKAKAASDNCFVVNRDALRSMGYGGDYIFNQEREPMIFKASRRLIEDAVEYGYNVCVDETFIKASHRQEIISAYPDQDIVGVYFDTPVALCINRRLCNTKRAIGTDWAEVITKMYHAFEEPQQSEGFKELKVFKCST